jgi:hypothetical protein
MALKKSVNNFSIPAEGTIPARLARIVEVGVQDTKFGDKDQVILSYSLPTRLIEDEGKFQGKQHFIQSGTMTMSTNEKASLTKHINAMDRHFLEADELDIGSLLNSHLYLTIVHNPSQDGTKTYANISNIMQTPEGMEVGSLDTTPYYFDYENPDLDIWTMYLSDWVKEKITSSLNYDGSAVQEMVMRMEAMASPGKA